MGGFVTVMSEGSSAAAVRRSEPMSRTSSSVLAAPKTRIGSSGTSVTFRLLRGPPC